MSYLATFTFHFPPKNGRHLQVLGQLLAASVARVHRDEEAHRGQQPAEGAVRENELRPVLLQRRQDARHLREQCRERERK